MSITKAEYAQRREHLMAIMGPGSVAIIPSAKEQLRSRDTDFPFRQDSDFYYLSGFVEPESVLVLLPGREHGKFVMFCREREREWEQWDGHRYGPEGACEHFAADDAFPIAEIDKILPSLIEGRERIYYSMGRCAHFDRQVMSWVNQVRKRERSGVVPPLELSHLDYILHDLRLTKSAGEMQLMREAADITARAHCRAMQYCQPGVFEYQLEAEILHEFAMAGARHPAYSTIVGGGANGCILHYIDNSAKLRNGDLVLIDAGCELEGYAADVTRTFPVNGKFNRHQQALYEIVLAAQEAAFAAIAPGKFWNEAHDATVQVITEGLVDLGLLQGDVPELIAGQAYRDFYMHRAGHWLGLDVHDVGDYREGGAWRILEPGMAMTVEPGIYVAPDNKAVAEHWRGIGIRVEDNVLVTAEACEITTSAVPRTVADIEALMSA